MFSPLSSPADAVRAELLGIINAYAEDDPRSRQAEIGPSEIGLPCSRRVAYILAGAGRVNRPEHWFATVGTAVHAWLAKALEFHNTSIGRERFLVEHQVFVRPAIDGLISGHCDFFDTDTDTVFDWKVIGAKALTDVKMGRIKEQYRVQKHLYGRGFERRGLSVKYVSNVFLPRSNFLRVMMVDIEPYDAQVAADALARLDTVDAVRVGLDLGAHPERWALVPAVTEGCEWCPFFRVGGPADGTGCPGPVAI